MHFRWKWRRLALGLVAYWLVSTGIAGIGVRLGNSDRVAAGSIIMMMVVFVIACMATERGQWKTWQRVGFVPLAWIVHALLTPVAVFTLLAFGVTSESRVFYRGTDFLASIPVVLYAAWRSRLFVTQVVVR
jgi:hypothetical protein